MLRFTIEDDPEQQTLEELYQGHGRTLMDMVEQAAVGRGCSQAILDTFSFQAPEFYQKLGYEAIASLDYGELRSCTILYKPPLPSGN